MCENLNRRLIALGAKPLCVALAIGLAGTAGGWAQAPSYRVHPGDVIEIAVAGLPELRARSNVQPDGAVSFPLVGAIKVAGLTPAEMREILQRGLAQKVYRQRAVDGREVLVVIKADEVSASILEYNPIYVNGDVTRPGELIFRPEMSVRQAIALAGGANITALRSQNPAIEAATVKGEYEAICVELAKTEARIARIAGELASLEGKEPLLVIEPQDAVLPQAELARIQKGENDIMQARLTDFHREREFLRGAIDQLSERATVLEKQRREEEEGARADTEDLKRMIDLLAHGNVANPRVLEARRALLLSQTRALQVTDGLLQIKKQSTEMERKLQHYEDDRKEELLKERQDAEAEAGALKIKRDAAQEKLNLLSLARSRLSVDDASKMEIQVVRKEKNASTKLSVDGDFPLEPGDVIEVAVKAR